MASYASSVSRPDRSARRRRVLLGGKLVFGVAGFSVDCAIRDLSEAGARLKLPLDLATPDEVWLIDINGAAAYRASVAWRNRSELGLTFTEHHDLRAPTPPTMLHLRMLWLECATRRNPTAPNSLD